MSIIIDNDRFVFVVEKRIDLYVTRITRQVFARNFNRDFNFNIHENVSSNIIFNSFFNYKHVFINFNQLINDVSKIQMFANKRVLQNITSTTNNVFATKKSKTRKRKSIFIIKTNARFITIDIIVNDDVIVEFKNENEKSRKQFEFDSRKQSRVDFRVRFYVSRSFFANLKFSRFFIRRASKKTIKQFLFEFNVEFRDEYNNSL